MSSATQNGPARILKAIPQDFDLKACLSDRFGCAASRRRFLDELFDTESAIDRLESASSTDPGGFARVGFRLLTLTDGYHSEILSAFIGSTVVHDPRDFLRSMHGLPEGIDACDLVLTPRPGRSRSLELRTRRDSLAAVSGMDKKFVSRCLVLLDAMIQAEAGPGLNQ